jgi:hypothetical protein
MMKTLSFTTFRRLFSVGREMARALLGAALIVAASSSTATAAGGPLPSTFGSTIGQALLCVDQVDPFYFWSYLNQFFGPPYKAEGGAYWFKVPGTLWGAAITDVLVSDGASEQVFLAAVFKDNPTKLSGAIAETTGVRHNSEDFSQFSPLVSGLGSKIIYFEQGSKIYCAKYNLDYMRQRFS